MIIWISRAARLLVSAALLMPKLCSAEVVYSTNAVVTSSLTIAGEYEIKVNPEVRVVYSGKISGAGTLKVSGGGTLILSAANEYAGGTILAGGYLCVSNNHALGTGELKILGQRDEYSGPCELDLMGAGLNDNSVLRIANPIRISGTSTPKYPALMSFGQNNELTGKIVAEDNFYFYDDTQSTKEIWSSQYNRYTKVTSLTFGEIDCAGILGNRGFVTFVFGGKVKAKAFDLVFERPLQRTGDEAIGNNAHSTFIFMAPSQIGVISNYNHHIYCACANALAGVKLVQPFLPNGFEGSSNICMYKLNSSVGYDQTIGAFSGMGIHDQGKLSWAYVGTGGKTLTIKGVASQATNHEEVCSTRLSGWMNLQLDAYDGFCQVFSNRNHTISGNITVKRGELRFDGLATLSNVNAIAINKGARLSLPEHTEVKVRTLTIEGVSMGPGIYYGEKGSAFQRGTIIRLTDKGEVPEFGSITAGGVVSNSFALLGDREWKLRAGEKLTFDNAIKVFRGSATIVSPKNTSNPAWVEFRGTNTIDGALISTAAVVSVSGLLATPNHINQGVATDQGATTLTINGYPGGAYLYVSNAIIEKPIYLCYSGFGAIRSASGTTNVIKGHVTWPVPWPGFTVAANSEIVFEGGIKSGHTLRTNGEGNIRIREQPIDVTASVGWNIAYGKVCLDVAGNRFSYLCVGHQDGSNSELEFGVKDAIDVTSNAALLNGYKWDDGYSGFRELKNGRGRIRLGKTIQRVNSLCGGVESVIYGETGAGVEILKQEPDRYIRAQDLYLASKLEGDVSLIMKGSGRLVLTNRTFETTGALRIYSGTVELAENAAWKGTGSVDVYGNAHLVLKANDQLNPNTRLRLYDDSVVEMPAGKTLNVRELDVWDGAGWIRFATKGEVSAATSSVLARHISGGGKIFVTGTEEAVNDGKAAEFALEWNRTYDTSVPYEVEVDVDKLTKLSDLATNISFEVYAVVGGKSNQLATSFFNGRRPNSVVLRFAVPTGTDSLFCRAISGKIEKEDSRVANIFAGALDASANWTVPSNVIRENRENGLMFRSKSASTSGYAVYSVEVPSDYRGKAVRLELMVMSESVLPWGGYIRFWQYDSKGERLPESVSDVRWTSHMRPSGKLTEYKENGRIHPQAARIEARFEVRGNSSIYDNHGEVLEHSEDAIARLLITKLVMRKAAELPFPKYEDGFFGQGVSTNVGDKSLVLGGENYNGFFYATHSHAAWSENIELKKESQKFFPTKDGTIEAWFKPRSWASKDVYLFSGFQGYSAKKSASGRGELVTLKYLHTQKRLTFSLKDRDDRTYSSTVTHELPIGEWRHITAQWSTNGQASVSVNGAAILNMDISGYKGVDAENEQYANEEVVTEFFLGCHSKSARNIETATNASYPLFEGEVDLLRVSTGTRYGQTFSPPTKFTIDANTRALFTFDRTFDGGSGGDFNFIRGSIRSFADRVQHKLKIGDKEGWYYPEAIMSDNDHRKVLNINNYPILPTVKDFKSAAKSRKVVHELRPGEGFRVDITNDVWRDYIEIANVGKTPLIYPALINAGEIDPRSFGDIKDTMGLDKLSDKDCANKIFQFVLGASDYFMNHTASITALTDKPEDVEYQALTMLNGYCGFECGPLNSMTKNIFTCSGGLPASQTGGYGHSFEQVFYDGKNHIYDLSAQKFFPAMDNETAAYLEEAGDQPGVFHRIGADPDHFIRKASRGPDASSPSYREKVAMTLNPGERIRLWFDNNSEVNDLQCALSQVNNNTNLYKENYDKQCNVTPGSAGSIWRVHRYFPHYGNGFIVYEGGVDLTNPAFYSTDKNGVIYKVKSCYPIVAAQYSARLKDGKSATMQISTDGGVSWRTLSNGLLRYEVRARSEYLIRASAKATEIENFSAMTEVQINVRILTGRLRQGSNELTLKAKAGEQARVTMAWREPSKPIVIEGGVYSGTIPGSERQLILIEPNQEQRLRVSGISNAAIARTHGGIGARLEGGQLIVTSGTLSRGFGAVDIEDEGVIKQLTVLVCEGARLVAPNAGLTPSGNTTVLKADEGRVQDCLNFTTTASTATANFKELPAGKYAVMGLDRFESHPSSLGNPSIQVTVPGSSAATLCYPANGSAHYLKAHYGREGVDRRANFKWGYPVGSGNNYYEAQMRVFDVANKFSSLSFKSVNTWTNGVELAAVLVVPCDNAGETEDLYCDLIKVLCGLNCQPWRVTAGLELNSPSLRPTFCSCSVDWREDKLIDGAAIEYRPVGSSWEWKRAPKFERFEAEGEYRGSILNLEEDTEYEVRIVSGLGEVWSEGKFRTWKSEVPIAKIVTINPKTATFPITISEQGTDEGWIKYVLPDGAALTNKSTTATTFMVKNAAYVVFDDMKIVGGAQYVFEISSSKAVRIRNCDLSGWGRVGVPRYDLPEGGKRYVTTNATSAINFDGAIRIRGGTKEAVVERCYVHDPRGRANSWYYSHPAGPEAVVMDRPDHSTVLRWNDFCGGTEHRYNDVVEGAGNFNTDGGFNRDADVYGNYMGFSNDDAIELDGGMRNVRCFGNRFEYNYCGVSIQGCMVSPVYVYRNLFSGMNDEFELTGQTVKTSTSTTGVDAISFLWDNILWGNGSGLAVNSSMPLWHLDVTGNVFCAGQNLSKTNSATTKSIFTPNFFVDKTEAQLDASLPERPLPFVLSRTGFSNVKVSSSGVRSIPAGKIDIGAAVFRYSGRTPAVIKQQFVSTTPVAASTNVVQVFDVRNDLTIAADMSSGALPFAKIGGGTLILQGDSPSALYKIGSNQPGSGYPAPVGQAECFELPNEGTLPSRGYGMFSLLDGDLKIVRGNFTVAPSAAYSIIGGWTANEGEQEKDVCFEVKNAVANIRSRLFVGYNHGIADYNTPRGPAKATIRVGAGGEFKPIGYVTTFGSLAKMPNKNYNTDIRLEVLTNGLFTTEDAYTGVRLSPLQGQKVTVLIDGGKFQSRLVYSGHLSAGTKGAATTTIDICNGGEFVCEVFTNNVYAYSQAPDVAINIRDGGRFFVDEFNNRGGDIDMMVDGGIIGDANINGRVAIKRRQLVPNNCKSLRIGSKGMTVRAMGQCQGEPIVCVVGTPITSALGKLRVEAAPGNRVEFVDGSSFEGKLELTGGSVNIPAGVTVDIDDISAAEEIELNGVARVSVKEGMTVTTKCVIKGNGRLIKVGGGTLCMNSRVSADTLVAEDGTIILNESFNPISKVRFVRGIVKLGANEALSLASLEWTDPTAALETCAYLDLNGHTNTNGCMRSVCPETDDGHFWIKNSGSSVTWMVGNPEPGTNTVYLGVGEKVNFRNYRSNISGATRGIQVLSNFVSRANVTFASQGYVVAGEVRFTYATSIPMHSGAATEFAFSNEDPMTAFPKLRRLQIDSHTLTMNDRALTCFNAIRRRFSLQSNKASSFVLPTNSLWKVATWIERGVSPNRNVPAGIYGPSYYKQEFTGRSLKPESVKIRVMSDGPGEVVLPDPFKVLVR